MFQFSVSAASGGFTVVIDPGHGGKDSGTKGATCLEKDIVLAIGLKLGELIASNQPDVRIIYTRKTDVFIELNQRAIIANKAKADLFISLHADHSDAPGIRGACTFTLGQNRTSENMAIAKRENAVILLEDNYKQRYEGFDPNSAESYIMFEFMQENYMDQSVKFASMVQDKFRRSGRIDRSVRQDVFLVLRCTSMPSALIETGFLSNADEEQYLKSSAGQEQVAMDIYRGFADFRAHLQRKSTSAASMVKPEPQDHPAEIAKPDSTRVERRDSAKVREGIVYKVQILASDRKLTPSSKMLKGQEADFYQEKGFYKYTVGTYTRFNDADRKRKELSARFPDCFVVAWKEGKKMPIESAKTEESK
jgi:N-acetylmuramoyl-L-alanine amidase